MSEEVGIQKRSGWSRFFRKHWTMVVAFALAAILALVGIIYVFFWFSGNAQSTGLVPSTLGLWTMGNTILFMLHLMFWALVFIGVPAVIGAVIGWQWWKRIPEQERQEYHLSGKGSRSSRAGGAISPLLFIAFALKVYVDGNWNVAISTYTLNYVVASIITILAWIAVIAAIPLIIGLIWWIRHEMNKP